MYAYLSSLPFSALAAGGIVMALGRVRLTRVAAALAAILVALGVLTWRQSGAWHDSLSLWAHALGAGQSGYVVHLNYGAALRASGRVDAGGGRIPAGDRAAADVGQRLVQPRERPQGARPPR